METPRRAGLAARAWAILVRPARTWDEIAAEPYDARRLLLGYVAPLAAIPAVCGVIGALTFGFNVAGIRVHMSLAGLLLGAASAYALTFAALWLFAGLADLAAPAFGGERGDGRSLKLAVYAGTATWIAGVAELYPSLGLPVGVLAALWSLYTLYLALPRLTRIPPERTLVAFAAALAAILALAGLRGLLAARAAELGGPLSASYAPLR